MTFSWTTRCTNCEHSRVSHFYANDRGKGSQRKMMERALEKEKRDPLRTACLVGMSYFRRRGGVRQEYTPFKGEKCDCPEFEEI